MTMPVAGAVPPAYLRLLEMSTTPGSTSLSMSCSWALVTPEFALPQPDEPPGLKPLPGLKPVPGCFRVSHVRRAFGAGGEPWSSVATGAAPVPAARAATTR